MRRLAAIAFILTLASVSAQAHATGLRAMGSWTMPKDSSYGALSSDEWRGQTLDLSFSYSFLYPGRIVLVDVEGGYIYNGEVQGSLYDTYPTDLEGHGMYLGVRFTARVNRKVLEWLQPYVRTDFGWSWNRVQISGASLPAMHDWGNGGFIYVGGGVQLTVPIAFIRKTMRIRLTQRFSIGLSYEFGYLQSAPIKVKFEPTPTNSGDVEPIPVHGFSAGTLDLSGITHRFGVVIAF
ncbi:MAG: hypothetical protein JRG91_10195 [Deltaproteobacteria bacterium]|nr:hypothetical protein [Deltaproteobacteria bacterium]